jgi:serine/threonine-protein kinase RsbW
MTCVIENRMAEVDTVMQFIDGFMNVHHASGDMTDKIRLAAEEILTNIIAYAYDDGKVHTIRIELFKESDTFQLTIRDDGKPFNPLEHPAPKRHVSLAEAAPGGLGIHLVKSFSDRLEYSRIDNTNQLIVTFKTA